MNIDVNCPKHGNAHTAKYDDGTIWCQWCVMEDKGVRKMPKTSFEFDEKAAEFEYGRIQIAGGSSLRKDEAMKLARWQHSQGLAAIQERDDQIAKLEDALKECCKPESDGFGGIVSEEFESEEIKAGRQALANLQDWKNKQGEKK